MEPVTPVVPGLEKAELAFGKGQPEYQPLPGICSRTNEGRILTRWRFTDEEREQIAAGADLYLEILTFHSPLQPLMLYVSGPPDEVFRKDVVERFGLENLEVEEPAHGK